MRSLVRWPRLKPAGSIPQSARSIPQSSRSIPQSAGSIPQSARSIPQSAGSIPQSAGSIPQSAEGRVLLFDSGTFVGETRKGIPLGVLQSNTLII